MRTVSRNVQVYIRLLGEGVNVWRPVQAEHLGGNVYRILPKPADLDDESWEFGPGDEVVCEMVESSGGPILAATRRADGR